MERSLKIALIDLVHTTCGVHNNVVPLGIGLLATYLKKNLADQVDIKLFKEADKVLLTLVSWLPDVIGISQYIWNSELNLFMASLIKQLNPNCLVVAGGPNIEVGVEQRLAYLKKNNFIDIGVAYDGEIPLLELCKRLLNGEKAADLKQRLVPGTFCLNPINQQYQVSAEPAPRLSTLDVLGPIYIDGIFDQFLDAGYHPFMQTQRGCPFRCAYCNTSDPYNSKVLFLSPEIFKQDLEYLAKRFAGRPNVNLYLANTNMSLFKEDFPIAEVIRDVQRQYNWPKHIVFDMGKDPKKLLEMLSIIRFMPGLPLQTLTPQVLKNVNRVNLPFEQYLEFEHEVMRRTGENSVTALIMGLPGESKLTFLETLRRVINSGVQNIVIYTLIKLPGTPIASQQFSQEYKYDERFRIVPRDYSLINGKKIIEIEEVIVGTKDMSFADYLELRGLCFTIAIFLNSVELIPLRRFLLEYQLDIAQWIFNVHEHLKNYPDIFKSFAGYQQEAKEELFLSREELLKYYNQDENFANLLSSEKGDNLLRKYKYLVLLKNYSSLLESAIIEVRQLVSEHANRVIYQQMIDDLASYLKTRDLKDVLAEGGISQVKRINLNFDIPAWMNNHSKSLKLENFKRSCAYTVSLNQDQRNNLLNLNTHKDFNLSLQILYRDGLSKDFWPNWTQVKSNS